MKKKRVKLQSAVVMVFLLAAGSVLSASCYATTAQEYNRSGLAYGEKGRLPQAIAAFTKAVEMDPNFEKAYNNRGVVYYRQGDSTHAIFDFDEALQINPNYADAYCNRALAYGRQGDLSRAIIDFTKAIQTDVEFTKAYVNRGVAYFELQDYDNAWADVHRAEILGEIIDPKFQDALRKASGREK